jgi:hypothetical protein
MKTKMNFKVVILSLALIWSVSAVQAQDKKETTLFTNVKVFNGIDEKLMDVDVLVEGNLIKQVAKGIKAPKGATVIDGGGAHADAGDGRHSCASGLCNFTTANAAFWRGFLRVYQFQC